MVIETISQESYYHYIEKHIIKPLNLERTGFHMLNRLPFNTAIGYMNNEIANTFSIARIGSPDGGIYTCAKDIASLWTGIFNCKLFSKKMLEEFVTIRSKEKDGYAYFGLGVALNKIEDEVIYFHSGRNYGIKFITVYFPKIETVVTLLGNTELDDNDFVVELILLLIN